MLARPHESASASGDAGEIVAGDQLKSRLTPSAGDAVALEPAPAAAERAVGSEWTIDSLICDFAYAHKRTINTNQHKK